MLKCTHCLHTEPEVDTTIIELLSVELIIDDDSEFEVVSVDGLVLVAGSVLEKLTICVSTITLSSSLITLHTTYSAFSKTFSLKTIDNVTIVLLSLHLAVAL